MDFDLSEIQRAWQSRARALAEELTSSSSAGDAVSGAGRVGLLDRSADLLSLTVAAESLAMTSASAGMSYALHVTAAHALREHPRADALWRGETIGALALSADQVPADASGRLTGDASWVAPAIAGGVAIVGARTGGGVEAYAVPLDDASVRSIRVNAAGLLGLPCVHVSFDGTRADNVGATTPIMARARVLIAAVGLGIGRRALQEALAAARAAGGAEAEEQTVQGLLADTATELDAATLLTWEAAASSSVPLGRASIAKLSATEAAQHAVRRATQVVGAESFRRDHTIERLAQDVRALELFAGRTEALRAAVAAEILP